MDHLQISDVSFSYDGIVDILSDIHWTLKKGKFHALVGKSGCGKTSLLKVAAGLLPPTSGEVWLQEKQVTEPLTNAGVVFQSPTLLEWKTVLDNVLLPIAIKRKCTKEERMRAMDLLALMNIEKYHKHYPNQLSGGQQSRVAIARALIKEPSLLFLDEPFAALDALTREELQMDLLHLCAKQDVTVLFITHDLAEAVFLGDEIVVMDEGKIVHQVPIELEKPRTIDMRYGDSFNQYCLQARRTLEGVEQK